MVRILPNEASLRLMGVSSSSSPSSMPAMCPTSVPMPVATTMPAPRPAVTMAVANAMFDRSPSGAPGRTTAEASFSTGTDSPVSAASCMRSPAASTSRRSAGAMLPSPSCTRSPGTRSRAGTTISMPSRTTRASGALIDLSASSEDCALRSCTMPMTAFTITMAKMMPASAHSCRSADSTAATRRMRIMGSVSCSRAICASVRGGFAFSSLGPVSARRRAASSSLSPSSEESSSRRTSERGSACQGRDAGGLTGA